MAEGKKTIILEEIIDSVSELTSDMSLDDKKGIELLASSEDSSENIEEIWFDSNESFGVDGQAWCYDSDDSLNLITEPFDKKCVLKLRTIIYVNSNPTWDIQTIKKYGNKKYSSKHDLINWENELQNFPKHIKLDILEKYIYYRLLVSFENGYLVTTAYIEKWLNEALNVIQEDMTEKRLLKRWIKMFKKNYKIRSTMRQVKLQGGFFIKTKTLDFARR